MMTCHFTLKSEKVARHQPLWFKGPKNDMVEFIDAGVKFPTNVPVIISQRLLSWLHYDRSKKLAQRTFFRTTI